MVEIKLKWRIYYSVLIITSPLFQNILLYLLQRCIEICKSEIFESIYLHGFLLLLPSFSKHFSLFLLSLTMKTGGNKHIKYGSIKGRNCVTVKLKTIYFLYITPYYCNQILSCCFFFASFCAFKRTVVIEFYFYFWFNKSTFMWQSKLHILNV